MKNMASKELSKILERAVLITLQNYGIAVIFVLALSILIVPWWIQWTLFYLLGVLFACSIVASCIDDWRPRVRVPTQGKAVFISGCDSGFGHALAKRLHDLGLHVFAGCLFPDKGGALSLKKAYSDRLHVLPLDVTSDESVQNAVKYVVDNIGPNRFWAVVNNAGINKGGEVPWTSMSKIKSIVEVNTFGVVRVTKAFIPLLCKNKGRIITVASAGGRYTAPGITSYCMSKSAAISFSEGLRLELCKFGVKVVTIEPFSYRTPIVDKARIAEYLSEAWEESPEEIKQLYSENHVDRQKLVTFRALETFISDKPLEVVKCLEEAILACDPKYIYNPGILKCKLGFWVLIKLPKPIVDLIFIRSAECL